jgi:hypothetical protein
MLCHGERARPLLLKIGSPRGSIRWSMGPEQFSGIALRTEVDVPEADWRQCGSCGGGAVQCHEFDKSAGGVNLVDQNSPL